MDLPEFLNRAIAENPPIGPDEQAALSEAIRGGDLAARQRAVLSFLRLAIAKARTEDEFQEIVLGMVAQAATFDASQGPLAEHMSWGVVRGKKSHFRGRDLPPPPPPQPDNPTPDPPRLFPLGEASDPPTGDAGQDRVDSRELLALLLDTLPTRERRIVARRHGVGCEPVSIAQIASEEGIVETWIRLLYDRAMARLQRLAASENFSDLRLTTD